MKDEIKDKTRLLKEERTLSQMERGDNNFISRDINFYQNFSGKKRKTKTSSEFLLPEKRKKPVTVTDILHVIMRSCVVLN